MKNNLQLCSRCVMDSTVPGIKFDENGVCNFCKTHDKLDKQFPLGEDGKKILDQQMNQIKKEGSGNKYDCIIGISGGTDSTFCLSLAKKYGLRPLAVHLDNGWNTDIAIENMRKTVEKLDVDFRLLECDWDEFKDLQVSFLKASVPEVELPTDLAIHSSLYRVAAKENVKYVINGHNFRTEGLQPLGWCYMDGRYIKNVQKMFGNVKLKTFPNLTISDMLYFTLIKNVKFVPMLAYLNYDKAEAGELLKKELDWNSYGGHHFESVYTRFVITNILGKKFGIDKRKVSLSAAVRSGYISREEALNKLEEPVLEDPDIEKTVLNKLGISEKDFQNIMDKDPKMFLDYPTYYSVIKLFKLPIRVACNLNLLPEIFYEKYFNF